MARQESIQSDRVFITPEANRKRQAYIDQCKWEISGLGTVEVINGYLVITDVFLLQQTVQDWHTSLHKKAIQRLLREVTLAGRSTQDLKYWWHSHVEGDCQWSGTDTNTMKNTFMIAPTDFMVSTVGNKYGESKTRIDLFTFMNAVIDDIPLIVLHDDQVEYDTMIRKEIAALVTYEPPVQRTHSLHKRKTYSNITDWMDGNDDQTAQGNTVMR
jgi:hypothetical protein